MIYKARIYCHVCCKNVVEATTRDGPMVVAAPYCPTNPTHKVTETHWQEKERDA